METTIRIPKTSILASWFVIALLIGFFFINTVPKIVGLTDESLSIKFRALILLFSFFFIFNEFISEKIKYNTVRFYRLFLLFWLIYGFRIIYDLFIDPIKLFDDKGPLFYFQIAFGTCLVPSLALITVLRRYQLNFDYILKNTYGLLYIVLIISINYRITSDLEGRTVGDINVGIISIGHYGATLCLLSVYKLLSQRTTLLWKTIIVSGILVGFFGIVISASKSPLAALFIVLSLFIFFWYGRIKSMVTLILLGTLISLFFWDILFLLSNYFQSGFIDRLLYTAEIGKDEARESLLNVAIYEFLQNPIFGNAFLIQNPQFTGAYPHISVVEAFMATGVVGGIIFLILILKSVKISLNLIKSKSSFSWISLILLQYLVFGMFSLNLYSSDVFWISIVLILGFNSKSKI